MLQRDSDARAQCLGYGWLRPSDFACHGYAARTSFNNKTEWPVHDVGYISLVQEEPLRWNPSEGEVVRVCIGGMFYYNIEHLKGQGCPFLCSEHHKMLPSLDEEVDGCALQQCCRPTLLQTDRACQLLSPPILNPSPRPKALHMAIWRRTLPCPRPMYPIPSRWRHVPRGIQAM